VLETKGDGDRAGDGDEIGGGEVEGIMLDINEDAGDATEGDKEVLETNGDGDGTGERDSEGDGDGTGEVGSEGDGEETNARVGFDVDMMYQFCNDTTTAALKEIDAALFTTYEKSILGPAGWLT
jgi:hypothetical protein